MNKDYSDLDKAQWILENGYPDIKYIYERVDTTVFRRPVNHNGLLPPWINPDRTVYRKGDYARAERNTTLGGNDE